MQCGTAGTAHPSIKAMPLSFCRQQGGHRLRLLESMQHILPLELENDAGQHFGAVARLQWAGEDGWS